MTPSFRFRLERVRVVRERKEKLAQRELADALSRRSTSFAELEHADADVANAREEQRTAVSESVALSATELLAHQAFLERLEGERRERAGELERREEEVRARDAELVTAATEHEMLNRLRERRRREHERELARHELNLMDEITAARFRGSRA